jgi:hypothetical protein
VAEATPERAGRREADLGSISRPMGCSGGPEGGSRRR